MSNLNQRPEKMSDFFNVRVDGYNEHMKNSIDSFEELYQTISDPIPNTEKALKILDLGCGTGLELREIFNIAPNTMVTGIDLSKKMLEKLREEYKDFSDQLNLILGSYLEKSFGKQNYDYVISNQTIHHFLYEEKQKLYEKIKFSLKDNGKYIEGDYVASSKKKELQFVNNYKELMQQLDNSFNSLYHIDIPFTVETQIELLRAAGFSKVNVIYQKKDVAVFEALK